MYEKIPEELRKLDQWVCAWDGSKIPMRAFERKGASSVDPASWSGFVQAVACVEAEVYDHIGFVLDPIPRNPGPAAVYIFSSKVRCPFRGKITWKVWRFIRQAGISSRPENRSVFPKSGRIRMLWTMWCRNTSLRGSRAAYSAI